MRTALSAIVMVMSLAWPAVGQDRDQRGRLCAGGGGISADQSIRACTALIDAGVEARSDRAGVFANRGLAYLAKDENDKAVKDFNQALRLDPDDLRAVRGRATALVKTVGFTKAIRDYDVLIARNPADENLQFNRASTYLRTAQMQLGIQDGDRELITGSQHGVVQVYRSVHDYDQAMGVNPVDPNRFATLGVISLRKWSLDGALRGYNAAIHLNPTGARAYTGRGATWLIWDEPNRAVEDFDRALHIEPLDAMALANRATAWRDRGEPDRAIADLTDVIRLNPSDAGALTNRGNAWIDKGQFDRAIVDFDAAIRVRPYARAFESRGAAYTRLGKHELALRDFTEALRLMPWNPTALRHRCRARAILKQVGLANLDCLESMRMREDHPGTLENKGFVHLQGGHPREAISQFNAALRIQPRRASALFSRGIARQRRGDTNGGATDIAAAVAINPNVALGMVVLGIQ
ncbi:MAG: tetratricopeptide repeat protein [Reyranellaceae bacterium]